jgi:lipoic acid synthetase
MGLSYVVVTSVTRDDLPDGGALHFVSTLTAIRNQNPQTVVELLVPDFRGSGRAIRSIVAARPDVLGHNMETVPRLYGMVRPGADYRRSLGLFERAHALDSHIPLKSGLMLGLGESREEVRQTLEDLRRVGCTLLTLGQYLQPSAAHLPVDRFIEPRTFGEWRSIAMDMGFRGVASGPLVRSSYHARDLYHETIGRPQPENGDDHVQLFHGVA